jgi:hypothetical protein
MRDRKKERKNERKKEKRKKERKKERKMRNGKAFVNVSLSSISSIKATLCSRNKYNQFFLF